MTEKTHINHNNATKKQPMSTLKEKLLLPFNIILFILVTFFLLISLILTSLILFPLEFLTRNKTYHSKIINLFKFTTFQILKTAFCFYINEPINVIYDKSINDLKISVIISNHLTDFDWWHYIIFMNHLGRAYDIFFIAKDELSKIPIISYLLSILGVIYVKRAPESAENTRVVDVEQSISLTNPSLEKLKSDLKEVSKLNPNNICLIFPEGTILNGSTIRSSKRYVKKANIRLKNGEKFPVKNVLCPKSGGFQQIIESSGGEITNIINCTLISPYKNEENVDGKHLFDLSNFTDVFIKRTFNIPINIIAEVENISFLNEINNRGHVKDAYKSFLYEKYVKKNTLIDEMNNSELNFIQRKDIISEGKNRSFVYTKIPMLNKLNVLFFFCILFFLFWILSLFFLGKPKNK